MNRQHRGMGLMPRCCLLRLRRQRLIGGHQVAMQGNGGQKAVAAVVVERGGILVEQVIALLQQSRRAGVVIGGQHLVAHPISKEGGIEAGAWLADQHRQQALDPRARLGEVAVG